MMITSVAFSLFNLSWQHRHLNRPYEYQRQKKGEKNPLSLFILHSSCAYLGFRSTLMLEICCRSPQKLLASWHLYDYRRVIYRLYDIHHENKHDELISCTLMGMYLWHQSFACVLDRARSQSTNLWEQQGGSLFVFSGIVHHYSTVCQWHKGKTLWTFFCIAT